MANYFEKVSVFIDVKAEKALSGLKQMAQSIKEAEGVTGKAKATFKAFGDSYKAATATPAASLATMGAVGTAAAATGKILLGLAEDFMKTALGADNLGKAIGVSTEEASRWIAVGDDVGLTAEDLQAGLGKVVKNLDTAPWQQYGIATKDAQGKLRPLNEIMVDALGTIGAITDPTLRAKAGNDLLGKSYAALTPLIGQTRAQLEEHLKTVDKSQLVTDDQVKKAKDLQASLDNLSDSWNSVKKETGAAVAPAASGFFNWLSKGIHQLRHPTEMWRDITGETTRKQKEAVEQTKYLAERTNALAYSEHLASMAAAQVAQAHLDATQAVEDNARAVGYLHDETDRLVRLQEQQLQTVNDLPRAHIAEQNAIDAQTEAVKHAIEVSKDHKATEEEKQKALRDVQQANMDAADAIYNTAQKEAEAKGFADKTNESYSAQIGYLEDAAKKYPALKGEIEKYIEVIKGMPGFINTPGAFKTPDFAHGGGPGGTSLTGGPTINITVNGALDSGAVARQIDRMLRDLYSRGGGLGVTIYGGRR